jgi:alkaline phosphatase D
MPFPKSARPTGDAMRIYGHLDWGRLARIQLLDNRQYRDPQVCPRPGRLVGSHTVSLKACPALLDPQRSLLGAAQERWLAQNWSLDRPWNLVAQQTLMSRLSWTDPAHDPTYWTDGWDGYPAARRRLLESIAGRPGPLVLGGDIHTHVAADLRLDFEDLSKPVVASEFCCTSISSLGPPQSRVDASRAANPHIRYAQSDRRGYIELAIDADGRLHIVGRATDATAILRARGWARVVWLGARGWAIVWSAWLGRGRGWAIAWSVRLGRAWMAAAQKKEGKKTKAAIKRARCYVRSSSSLSPLLL